MKIMTRPPFDFVEVPFTEQEEAHVVVIPGGLASRDELFDSLERGLGFPYFGRNWDALEELLHDLEWVKTKRVIIVHAGLPRITDRELRTYLEILAGAVEDWRNTNEHELRVVFPASVEPRVRTLLN